MFSRRTISSRKGDWSDKQQITPVSQFLIPVGKD